MQLRSAHATISIPDGTDESAALSRCSHLAIGTHADDVELLGMNGIQQCYQSADAHFVGVVVTDGAGSPRTGAFADVTNDEMIEIRKQEQIAAATRGQYSAQIQLAYPSSLLKQSPAEIAADLLTILEHTQPQTIYLHNPLDRHASHRAALEACLIALRQLPQSRRPTHCYGVEVWRSLDFLPKHLRIALPTDYHQDLSQQLIGVFKSQTEGGKRYDLAFAGRGLANATFAESHHVDRAHALSFAVDLNPLIDDSQLSQTEFALQLLTTLMQEVQDGTAE